MVTKPLIIGPGLQSQDYSGFVRQSMGAVFPGGANGEDGSAFAQALQAQSAAESSADAAGTGINNSQRSNALSARQIAMPGVESDPLAGKELSQSGFMEINGKRAMALDSGSLATLQRISTGGMRVGSGRRTLQQGKDVVQGFDGSLGSLSARFESGSRGSSAVGYDRNGGTSYGKYQISSRQGTFDQFLKFLDKEEPDMARTLRAAGQANTGTRSGSVPDAWREIAASNPGRLEELEENFIKRSHYDPAASDLRGLLGKNQLSQPLQEVVWSTAVQHGPTGAKNIFEQAYANLPQSAKHPLDEAALIENIYAERSTKFGSSTPAVREAVLGRFRQEKAEALALVRQDNFQMA